MIHQLPSLGIALWSVATFTYVGDKKRVGWLLGMIGEIWWTVYATWSHQWGFYVAAVFYFAVYLRNWLRWGHERSG